MGILTAERAYVTE